MSKIVLYIGLLLLLCAGSYWLGTKQSEVEIKTETVTKIDTVLIDSPLPPIKIDSIETKIVYLTKADTLRDTITTKIPVYLPIKEYTFEQDSLYKIKAKGYDVKLTSVEMFNRNTTTIIKEPPNHWSLNASISSCIYSNTTDIAAAIALEYSKNNWNFEVGYQAGLNGNNGVMVSVTRKLALF
ncbi:MAG: hypothetical protein R3Y50_10175 [Rikenellaceae bacterium]